MYFIDGEYTGVYSNCDDLAPITMNEEDFGLDETKLKLLSKIKPPLNIKNVLFFC